MYIDRVQCRARGSLKARHPLAESPHTKVYRIAVFSFLPPSSMQVIRSCRSHPTANSSQPPTPNRLKTLHITSSNASEFGIPISHCRPPRLRCQYSVPSAGSLRSSRGLLGVHALLEQHCLTPSFLTESDGYLRGLAALPWCANRCGCDVGGTLRLGSLQTSHHSHHQQQTHHAHHSRGSGGA
jgi:hypothetical protein